MAKISNDWALLPWQQTEFSKLLFDLKTSLIFRHVYPHKFHLITGLHRRGCHPFSLCLRVLLIQIGATLHQAITQLSLGRLSIWKVKAPLGPQLTRYFSLLSQGHNISIGLQKDCVTVAVSLEATQTDQVKLRLGWRRWQYVVFIHHSRVNELMLT